MGLLMRTQRLLGLLGILANVDKITIQELADRFEVSRRTIFRDLDTLNCAGIPIVAYPGMGGGVAIMAGYKVDKTVLSTGDTEKIFTALNGLQSIDGDVSITPLIAKLVPEQGVDSFSHSPYIINLASWFSDSITHDKTTILHQAICDRHCIRMEYVSSKARLVRIIEPYQLIFKQSNWYVYAFCQIRKDFRLFKLNRMICLEVLEELFPLRPVKHLEFQNDYGENLFSAQHKEGFFEVILEYDLADEFALTQKIDASFFQQQVDPGLQQARICFYTSNLPWISEWILGMLDKVRVISPLALCNEIKRRLDKITSCYKG